MHRIGITVVAGQGRVLLQWPAPLRVLRLPYQEAFALARRLVVEGQRAEGYAGVCVDRMTPVPVVARFRAQGAEVVVDWGVRERGLDVGPAEAFAFANALVVSGERAQRRALGVVGMTITEVEGIEEAIVCGRPTIVQRPPAAVGEGR